MKLPKPVKFEWDEGNIEKNWMKHTVHYKEAEEVFSNKPIKIYLDVKHSTTTEKRFTALGLTDKGRYIFITFIIKKIAIRIISARDQSKKERGLYEKKP